jgi:hypothetical protein
MELSDKRLPPSSTTEYFEKLSDPVALAVVIVTSPFFVLVTINWTIKKFELLFGTKTTKRHTVSFRANTRQFKIIGFRPFYFIIYLRHGGLVNLKKGDMVDIEKSSMGRMIKFNKV